MQGSDVAMDCASLRVTSYICIRRQYLILHAGELVALYACSKLQTRLDDAIGYGPAAARMSP
jgi:hypothetical protein